MTSKLRRLAVVACLLASTAAVFAAEPARLRDVVYGHKYGTALVMDVLQPAEPNGAGVLLMMSGGFTSDVAWKDAVARDPALFAPLLDRGYTLFLVCHGSQPKYLVPEIVGDIHRAVRFVRTNADQYGIEPDRLGITGTSSGGYLSLMIGTRGSAGDPAATDPVDQASSRVQAVACFCPPTDLVDYGKPGRMMLEFQPVAFVWHTFALEDKPRDEQIAALRELSPLSAISSDTPPTLILHGTDDELVPYEQAVRFVDKLMEQKVAAELVTRQSAGHTWPTMGADYKLVADWFDRYLGVEE